MFQTVVVEEMKTHILCSITPLFLPLPENRAVYEIIWKHCREGQTTEHNMAHAHCMLDTKGYKHTFIICNTYCFSTATMAARTPSVLRYTYIACLVYGKLNSQISSRI
jgi:hypothetical protein